MGERDQGCQDPPHSPSTTTAVSRCFVLPLSQSWVWHCWSRKLGRPGGQGVCSQTACSTLAPRQGRPRGPGLQGRVGDEETRPTLGPWHGTSGIGLSTRWEQTLTGGGRISSVGSGHRSRRCGCTDSRRSKGSSPRLRGQAAASCSHTHPRGTTAKQCSKLRGGQDAGLDTPVPGIHIQV